MQLKDFIKKTETGLSVEFSEAQGKNGKVLLITSGEDKFILNSSTINFQKFREWVGQKAFADIRRLGKFYKTEFGFLPLVEIRTVVKIDSEIADKKDYDYDYFGY